MGRNPNDIRAYRKEKKRKTNMSRLLITVLAVFAIVFVLTFRETIFKPLQGIANRLDSPGRDEGFPIVLSGSAEYYMRRVDMNFLLLSDTYLYTYTNRGGQVIAHRHNYARPSERATHRRILLYNFNGHEFSLFNRNGRVYEIKLDDRIVLAELGSNDMTAVVTTSAAFSNILYIYDGNGKWRYTKRFIDENVNAVTFSSKSNEIIVATSFVRSGELFSKIYRLRTDTEDSIVWEQELPAGAWALQVRENGENILVLADTMFLTLDSGTGELSGSYSFDSGRLVKDVYGDDFNLVVLSDYATGRTLFVTLDLKSDLIKTEIMPFEAKQVEISGEIVYTLSGDTILKHDMFLNPAGITELDDEYRDFIILDKYALLLGYETIERVALE